MHNVVLADDVPEFLSWLCAELDASEDYAVVGQAQDGGEALALIQAFRPDLVLADVNMPVLDGPGLARAVRSVLPETKVVLFSAHADSTYARVAKAEGAVAFIPKARFSLAALTTALRAAE